MITYIKITSGFRWSIINCHSV